MAADLSWAGLERGHPRSYLGRRGAARAQRAAGGSCHSRSNDGGVDQEATRPALSWASQRLTCRRPTLPPSPRRSPHPSPPTAEQEQPLAPIITLLQTFTLADEAITVKISWSVFKKRLPRPPAGAIPGPTERGGKWPYTVRPGITLLFKGGRYPSLRLALLPVLWGRSYGYATTAALLTARGSVLFPPSGLSFSLIILIGYSVSLFGLECYH